MTEIRPLYIDDEPVKPLVASVIAHQLRIDTLHNGSRTEIFIALDNSDLETLKSAIDRAIRKSMLLTEQENKLAESSFRNRSKMPKQHKSLIELGRETTIERNSNRPYILSDSSYSRPGLQAPEKSHFSSEAVAEDDRSIEAQIKSAAFILLIENELDDPDFVAYSEET